MGNADDGKIPRWETLMMGNTDDGQRCYSYKQLTDHLGKFAKMDVERANKSKRKLPEHQSFSHRFNERRFYWRYKLKCKREV